MDFKNIVTRKGNYICGLPFNSEVGKAGLGCFLYKQFQKHAEKIFQVHAITGASETYSSVLRRSIRVAVEMKRRGVTEDDIIILCTNNSMDCFIPVFATQLLNATIACLDPSQSVRDIVYLLNLVEPKMIFAEDAASDLISDAISQSPNKPEIIIMGNKKASNSFSYFEMEHPEEDCFKPTPLKNYNKRAVIIFSSGTTGMPKGICVSGYGILSTSLIPMELGHWGDTVIHNTSFYWISALMVTLPAIWKGSKKVILPKYDLDTFLKAVQNHKISFGIIASNIIYEMTEEICSKYDLTSLNIALCGGTTISKEHMIKCRKLLSGTILLPAYGLTEANGLTSLFPKEYAEVSYKYPDSCGVPTLGVTMKIVNPETEEIQEPNQLGEIRISTKFQFLEYHKQDTSNAFDREGFIKTGDIGYFDDNNLLYVCDRIKDMFKYKSWHIVPASLERVIYQHSAVKEAVVVGVPHPADGDHPMALVVLKENFKNVKEEELKVFFEQKVLDREKLRGGLKIVKAFPKTPSGKIKRDVLRKKALEHTL